MRTLLRAMLLVSLSLIALSSFGAIEELSFNTEQEHARYLKLIEELRCPKCLNVNLAGSDAPIAQDLRAEVYEQIMAGNEDEQIIDFMVVRYGDFILYRPPLNAGTILLWFGPLALLLGGFFIARRMISKSSDSQPSENLSSEEQQKLDAMLSVNKDKA